MFYFGNANEAQQKAITAADGPVLITAGPGTGKTYTLVQRTIYLIEECKIKPERIFIATFTEKAAKELVTRITNELSARGIVANINEMYVGTFHSLCLRFLKEYLEYTRLRKNYRILDGFDQRYTVYQKIDRFRKIEGIDNLLENKEKKKKKTEWKQAEIICNYVNTLAEELVSADDLMGDDDESISVLGRVFSTYQKVLSDDNLMDFSSIQTEAYHLLLNNPEVLAKIRSKITHIMVDEYQDTNYIQEQIVFLLAGEKQNICVVGDDDQGLYRFRGATIRNILEFRKKFPDGKCKIIQLVINYRSNSDIVNFYNNWMETTEGPGFRFDWNHYRYEKRIEPHQKTSMKSRAVIKLSSSGEDYEWHEKILQFIKNLKESDKITDYNQIAFLFRSVKNSHVKTLANYLEKNGINVYSPRSGLFFQREEIRLALGCLMLMFPDYAQRLDGGEFKFLREEHVAYFRGCIISAVDFLNKPENKDLKKLIRNRARYHDSLSGTTDYAFSGLIYRIMGFQPFVDILGKNLDAGVIDERPARNLAKLTQIICKYEHLNRIDVFDSKAFRGRRKIDRDTEKFFNKYIRLLYDEGFAEYEDDSEYAPSGCVSFLTIHQSKGMEFPIVVVDSLNSGPRKSFIDLMVRVERRFFKRQPYEPYDDIKFFDFWRLYYTAFSRAQDLLILSCREVTGRGQTPSKYFSIPYDSLPKAESEAFDINEFSFKPIKDVNLKDTYSFTSHIALYENCSLQYKFYRELEFAPVRAGAMLFGTLVHETIEDVHRAAIQHKEKTITEDNVCKWFEANYDSLSKNEHAYLGKAQQAAALKQVLRYVENQHGNWSIIQQAEVDVSLVKPTYIIEGKIDLIRGEEDTVEIVDFKAERKPDLELQRDRIERYRRQLHVYAHLVEERTGKKVSKMHLYYTAEDNGVPTITFPYTKSAVEGTIAVFDSTVQKIMNREFYKKSDNRKLCEECDFRFFCEKMN